MLFYSLMPLGPALAAEVHGVDLSAPLDPDTAEALAAALAAHLVLVFRGQSLTRAQYRQAAETLPVAAATLLYGAAAPAPDAGTSIANLRAARDELPEAEQARLALMPPEEMRTQLRDRVEWLSESYFIYRHLWRQGDLLLIDDRTTAQRGADPDAGDFLWRLVVEEQGVRVD